LPRQRQAIFRLPAESRYTIEAAREEARGLKEFIESRVDIFVSFECQEICELCKRSYWQTVTLTESKSESGWTCQVSDKSFRPQGLFYLRRADVDRYYPAPQPQAEPQPSSTAPPKPKPQPSSMAPREPKPKAARRGSDKQETVLNIAKELYPDGYAGVKTGKLIKHIGNELTKRKLPVPKRDTFLRALGRREG
jgi:hypothetical protein